MYCLPFHFLQMQETSILVVVISGNTDTHTDTPKITLYFHFLSDLGKIGHVIKTIICL